MKEHQPGRSSHILFVLMGFALLCAGTLLAVPRRVGFATTSNSGSEEPVVTCQSETTELALQDTARADLALREKNFGDAQIHIQRARVRLEAAVAVQNSGK